MIFILTFCTYSALQSVLLRSEKKLSDCETLRQFYAIRDSDSRTNSHAARTGDGYLVNHKKENMKSNSGKKDKSAYLKCVAEWF